MPLSICITFFHKQEKYKHMKGLFTVFLVSILCLPAYADNSKLYEHLDSVIAQRDQYTKEKEQRIEQIKKSVVLINDKQTVLKLYNDIYNEYHYFRYDSAMAYVKKGKELSIKENNTYYYNLNTIHQSMLLAACGLYSEAKNNLENMDKAEMDSTLRYEYNLTLYWLYTYWSDYCNDSDYRTIYWQNKLYFLKSTIPLAKGSPNDYNYLMGEYYLYANDDHKKALAYYNKVLENEPDNSRLYSTACFAASCCYSYFNNHEKEEEYMIRTAITDIISPVKENLSVQNLAMMLFNSGNNLKRAEKYIYVSMEDAKFYNNRLRIIDISNKLPVIMAKYKDMMNSQNNQLRNSLVGSIILLICLIMAFAFIIRQNKLLTKRRHEVVESNRQLTELNGKLSELNSKLTKSNEKMLITNVKRESLAKLYIDLCSKYIDKLSKYQKLVSRKIKAKQVNDLLSTMTSSRLSDEDAATFLHNFDKAFLDQYPTFVTEFNKLLLPEYAIKTKSDTLTTELRIFALIRLGVKESSEISNLLFYTPRTIYNYRSAVKGKAINKETFESDVQELCTVME